MQYHKWFDLRLPKLHSYFGFMGTTLASPIIFKSSKTVKDVLDNSCIRGGDIPLGNQR